ncbi:beta-N-acetylglucosaminidase domain-containing protein [Clostridium tertium]|uniref:beta-N-acetylglucosaminidase domain-containing protein n=1 Tax=Clostridium tertium TaxID=1559 RepID=UPI00115A65CD|nr:beta-N-acetylglucosaminidase domain-containing protein [Clostridium tertium]MDB1953716.1 beta-N-acetylglucosaminidase domain-containing protein [Clostridium tertium]MDB1960385.1 beta-N-acetylglucosaminidase domain-containing protein [Clostridium tertium]MDB1964162.1 beta-N-acetylglucosaminidase domain-containing protein [Clostridium tertium]MDB1964474.1 beta-N-acetylglucosaminidase domain-containing protein [Clostridium tertium]
MIKKSKRYLSAMLTGAILLSNMSGTISVSAETLSNGVQTVEVTTLENTEYEIYPSPQSIEYEEGSFSFDNGVNVVYESGIDIYTKARLENEILKANNIGYEVSSSNAVIDGKTNILVGIEGSGEFVDKYAEKYTLSTENLFSKIDSYFLAADNNIITVLGKDTDAAFYGLTTLYHVVNQINNNRIRNFKIEDYANVVTRGFIEGYYGNPWSVEDRSDLMTYGGYYKLNAYFYAPKDDPKHRVQWRSLYTEDELTWIKQLADAGNASKCRFVYGIHPFPGNDPFGINKNEDGYQKDLTDLKAKLKQVIDQGVRQVAILADDFANPGGELGLRLVNDITTWLETEVKSQYPDMKTTLPYIPFDYMGNGSSNEFTSLKQAPENVQLVMTGGRIWGEVTQNFSQTFKNNTGRAPYYWINWPCSDNSKKHLIMGGNDTFLHPGVDPTLIEGIMLNPMQQSEANKSALFAVADYSWNIWETKAEADQNWNDSFKYMDHNTAIETESSAALREISKHMINQNMDSRVTALQESIELAPKLTAFKEKYDSGALVKEDALALIEEFTKIKDAADYYKNNPGNSKTRDQIIYWLNCWEDTTTAAIGYLKAIIANEEGNNNDVWTNYSEAQAAFEKSKSYGFHYVDHTEYAEVGVQHIVPFIKTMEQALAPIVSGIVDPSKVVASVITNRSDVPAGNLSNVLDNNPSTEVVYKNPNTIVAGTYIGVKYNKVINIKDIEFSLGAISNPNDTMQEAKLQYTVDGREWIDLNEEVYTMPSKITVDGLNLDAMGVRVIATKDRSNTWFGVKDIIINKDDIVEEEPGINATIIRTPGWQGIYSGSESNLLDGNDSSDVWYKTHAGDMSYAGDYIGVDLGSVIPVGDVRFVVGRNGSGDKWSSYKLEYSINNQDWTTFKEYTGKESGQDIIEENLEGKEARYVRLTNKEDAHKWVIFSEISVKKHGSEVSTKNVYTNTDLELASIFENEELTKLAPKENITLQANEYIGIKLDRIKDLSEIALEVSNMDGLALQISMNGLEWTDVNLESRSNLQDARYVRLIANKDVTFNLNKFEVKSNEIYAPSIVESFVKINGKVESIFDKNFNSSASFDSYPRKDSGIVFDLGQTMNISNITYAVLDTEINYLRDAKFQISLDGKEWTDVITIGDGIENDDSDINSKPVDAGYDHGDSTTIVPISHAFVKGELDSAKEARYLRILFTANYMHRWVKISEILINDGEYVPAVNDPTFVSNPIEVEGFGPQNIKDGDLTTAYKPNTNNGQVKSGSLTYRLSENTDVKKINIVQSGNGISNAKVMVRTGYDEDGQELWNELGTLDKSLNEILNTKYDNIYEIRIDWEGVAPTIYEIVTINNYDIPNITDLEELISSSDEYIAENYTSGSFAIFTEALETAKSTLDNLASVSQSDIDKAKEDLVNAITGLVDIQDLKAVINKANAIIGSDVEYTEATFNALKEALEVANTVLANADATKDMVTEAIDNVDKAIDSLVVVENKPANKEQLQALVDKVSSISEEDLSKVEDESLVAEFKEALDEAKAILADEEATQEVIDASVDRLTKAIESLSFENTDKGALTDLIEDIMNLNSENYTEESWNTLKDKLEIAKEVLLNENATEEEVSKAYDELFKAFSELKVKPSQERLEALINKAEGYKKKDYTKESFEVLSEKLKAAKKVLKDKNATEADILKAELELQKAIDQLVVRDNNNGSNNNSNNGNNNSNNGSGNLPLTGGTSSLALVGIAVTLIGAGTVLRRRK